MDSECSVGIVEKNKAQQQAIEIVAKLKEKEYVSDQVALGKLRKPREVLFPRMVVLCHLLMARPRRMVLSTCSRRRQRRLVYQREREFSDSQTLRLSGSQALRLSGFGALRRSGSQALRLSGFRALRL